MEKERDKGCDPQLLNWVEEATKLVPEIEAHRQK